MAIWNPFGKKKESLSSAKELSVPEAQAAFLKLRPRVAYPAVLDDAAFAASFGELASIAMVLSPGNKLASSLAAAVAKPRDARALFEAGYQAYEDKLFDVAAALLARANTLAPGTAQVVAELATALEHMLRYGEAALILEASGTTKTDPICGYLAGFHWIMSGDVEQAARAVDALKDVVGPVVDMRDRLAGMVARANALQAAGLLEPDALTAWHAAINGTLLLHESPHGFPEPMHGRYAFVQDNASLMKHGIERLAAALDGGARMPTRIVHAPDRASRILALAASSKLSLPASAWSPSVSSLADALVVTWTLDAVQEPAFWNAVGDHAPGQVLFAHGSGWVDPFPFAPDVTTFLYQSVTNPFVEGALTDKGRGKPDERADDAIAADVVNAGDDDDSASKLDAVLAIRQALSSLPPEHAAGLFRTHGKRTLQRAGSVVPSARF